MQKTSLKLKRKHPDFITESVSLYNPGAKDGDDEDEETDATSWIIDIADSQELVDVGKRYMSSFLSTSHTYESIIQRAIQSNRMTWLEDRFLDMLVHSACPVQIEQMRAFLEQQIEQKTLDTPVDIPVHKTLNTHLDKPLDKTLEYLTLSWIWIEKYRLDSTHRGSIDLLRSAFERCNPLAAYKIYRHTQYQGKQPTLNELQYLFIAAYRDLHPQAVYDMIDVKRYFNHLRVGPLVLQLEYEGMEKFIKYNTASIHLRCFRIYDDGTNTSTLFERSQAQVELVLEFHRLAKEKQPALFHFMYLRNRKDVDELGSMYKRLADLYRLKNQLDRSKRLLQFGAECGSKECAEMYIPEFAKDTEEGVRLYGTAIFPQVQHDLDENDDMMSKCFSLEFQSKRFLMFGVDELRRSKEKPLFPKCASDCSCQRLF